VLFPDVVFRVGIEDGFEYWVMGFIGLACFVSFSLFVVSFLAGD